MSYKDLPLKHSYISYGQTNITTALINPALAHTKLYRRSVGFFSSGVLKPIFQGIVSLARNKGRIELIASPRLSPEDIEAINLGYAQREKIISDCFDKDFYEAIRDFENEELKILVELIARGYLDIKLAVTKSSGIYHDKLGLLQDFEDNIIAFYGSANSSHNAYCDNYEKIRISRSWIPGEKDCVADEKEEFEALWNGTNPFVDVIDYNECAKANLLQTVKTREENSSAKEAVKLRDYQEEAIAAWVNNGYRGFYVMATGTGKTWTAIYSAKKLMELHKVMIVICAPYKHLVKQWAEDVIKAYPQSKIVLVSSENPAWETQLSNEIIKKRYHPETQIIVISTIASFSMERFGKTLEKSKDDKLLIVDEAHRFTKHPDKLHDIFKFMLGLSATPFSGKAAQKGKELMNFFGGQVFNLPIEDALERGFLVPYNYFPIFVYATSDEEDRFRYHTQKIISCFKNNICINPDLLVKSLRARLRVISMAEEKMRKIDEIVAPLEGNDHFVVYCGDGRLYDGNTGEEKRHIQAVKKVLTDHGFRVSQFTAKENMDDRMKLVDSFNKGDISALAAIRCLDEGINIPSIKSALVLSSNDDYREFVQRRGRILRTYKGKTFANIYDVVVLPSTESMSWATIELRRFREYARLAMNSNERMPILEKLLDQYGIKMEEIDVFEYEDLEVDIDE